MQCIVTYPTGMYVLLSKISSGIFFYFGYLSSGHAIYVSKDVRLRGYFSKSKRGSRAKNLGNTDLMKLSCCVIPEGYQMKI